MKIIGKLLLIIALGYFVGQVIRALIVNVI